MAMPSASASKLRSTRCASTGSSIAPMSSRVTARRPCISARALEASTSAWPARGPAPQPMCLRTAVDRGLGRAGGAHQARGVAQHDARRSRCRAPAAAGAAGSSTSIAGSRVAPGRRGWWRRPSRSLRLRSGSRRRCAAGSGRAAPRAADRCRPARSGSASPARRRACGSLCVWPAKVTERSCIASSSADWVFGGARLISSASSTWVNTGPCWKRNTRWRVAWSSSRISVPTISEGIRSGVNCTRRNCMLGGLRQRFHQQRLAQSRHALDQRVAAAPAGR